ncbi:RED-like protein N-terminal region [Teratosphaeria destructans]|uniref:RED-like protein N-terminal region n=1 Tax=Teratosphaeria destructans TaxID=418781 RepID=A0A9W7SKD7_9PEZI|nr:RED-like protein N-terminal region [Teratosphaeria destructans]
MNNSQFRKLLSDQNGEQSQNAQPKPAHQAFGLKKASLVPMTPRNVKGGIGVDFARQVRERNAALRPTKKFKSSQPRGVKYGEGYTDRAKARGEADAEEPDSKAARIQALEEQMKLGQISQETFEALRDEITGGDVSTTHLVKGLDRRLLERVRRGEDVLGTGSGGEPSGPPADVDDELDKLGQKEVETVEKAKAEKKGTMASPNMIIGMKRSRDEIMAELKAQRQAAKEAKAAQEKATLGDRWRKVGELKSRVEVDCKGREVLITVDEDGTVKKRVRKVAAQPEETKGGVLDPNKPVLGSEAIIPAQAPKPAEEEDSSDGDIFEGVGTEYDPLGGAEEDSDEDSDDEETQASKRPRAEQAAPESPGVPSEDRSESGEASPPPPAETHSKLAPTSKRNYFGDSAKDEEKTSADRFAGIENVLKKAAKLDASTEDDLGSDEEAQAKRRKRAQMLAQQDRDMEDMDMGFGGSRFDDAEEAEAGDSKVRLSEWTNGDGDGDGKAGGKKKRERKPKRRKGDASNMNDIMRVIEGRKAGGK